jgi:hypothetical protein
VRRRARQRKARALLEAEVGRLHWVIFCKLSPRARKANPATLALSLRRRAGYKSNRSHSIMRFCGENLGLPDRGRRLL